MTNPTPKRPDALRRAGLGLLSGVLGAALLVGCSSEEPEEQTYTPPPPPPPSWTLDDIDKHYLVQFPEEFKPETREMAQAMADLASGLVSGDEELLRMRIGASSDLMLIDLLLRENAWESGDLKAARICNLDTDSDAGTPLVGIGLENNEGAYMLAWQANDADGTWTFSSKAIQVPRATTVAMLDGAKMVSPIFDTGVLEEIPIDMPTQDDTGSGRGMGSSPGGPAPSPGPGPDPNRDLTPPGRDPGNPFEKPGQAPPRRRR